MASILADRVKETTTSTGTGDLVLAGAAPGFRAFSAVIADGDTTEVCIEDATTGAWEVCVATYNAGPNSISRGALRASSTGARIYFGAGSKTVFITLAAAQAMRRDEIEAALAGKAAASHGHAAADLTDATAAGRALLTAADAAAQRGALGLTAAYLATVEQTVTLAGGVLAIDCAQGWMVRCVLTASGVTIANPTNATPGARLHLLLKQDATGGRTLDATKANHGSKLRWAGGTVPTLSTAAGARDRLILVYDAADDVWDVALGAANFS